MTNYEIMFIVKATNDEASIKKIADEAKDLIKGDKSKVVEFKELGRKKLAYPIKKEISGFYFLMEVEASKEVIAEFDRKCTINENILRHLIINKEGE